MGFFGGDDSDAPSRSEQLAEQQIRQNQAELENKRRNLYDARLDIIKSQGGQTWTPTVKSASSSSGGGQGGSGFPFPKMGGFDFNDRNNR